MNVLSLFDGISCGRVALDKLGIKVNRYIAYEIEETGIEVSKSNWDDIEYHGDVKQCPKYDDIDLLIGGSPCFVAGTKVITDDGYKNIEDIKVGDKVLTHNRRYRDVLDFGGKVDKTYLLKAQGIKPTEVTGNHPYYVRKLKRVWNNSRRSYDRVLQEPSWVGVKDLEKGDYLALPINQASDNHLNLTSEECYILGRYVADGHTVKHFRKSEGRPNDRHWQLILSLGSHKVDSFKDKVLENHFSCYEHSKSVHRAVFSNKRLVEIAERYCGSGAANKEVHSVFLDLPKDLLARFLEGYMDGDGCKVGEVFKASSISEELILSLNLAVAKVFGVNSLYNKFERPKKCIIEGREVNQKDTYTIHFRDSMRKASNAIVQDGFIWLPFKSVEECRDSVQVYNMEVAEDNTYTANNAVVHNCKDLSGAMRDRKGLAGKKSVLFFEYVRVWKECAPKYFFFENVGSMPKDDMDIITEIFGIEPIKINSKLVSAALRNRLYWTNIPGICQPEDTGVKLQDILESGYTDREKARALLSSDSRPLRDKARMMRRFYEKGFTTIVFEDPKLTQESCRYLSQIELERCMNLPDGYTRVLNRDRAAFHIGNGWTVDVIAHLFKGLLDEYS